MDPDSIVDGVRNWIHLLLPAVCAHTVLALALAFASPRSRLIRTSATVLTAALCLTTIQRRNPRSVEEADFGDYIFGLSVHASCYLLLKNLHPCATLRSNRRKLSWAIHALFSPRMDVPPPRRDPADMTKTAFILRRLAVAACGLLAWSQIRGWALLPTDFGPWDVTPDKDSMISQLLSGTFGLRELWIRAAIVVSGHAGSALIINTAHCLCAAFTVCVLGSPISEWPPLFGNIFEAYSIRRYYSHFWHKLMRKGFTLHSVLLTKSVLGLRKETAIGRATVVMLSFFISGVMHTITGWTPGPCQSIRPLWGYLQIGLIILLEQAVQQVYRRVHRKLGMRYTPAEAAWWRAFGYCWVVFYWLSSVTPVYKAMRCSYRYPTYS